MYTWAAILPNVVAAGLAPVCEVQIAYCIGVAQPVSVLVSPQGTSELSGRNANAPCAKSLTCAPTLSASVLTSSVPSTPAGPGDDRTLFFDVDDPGNVVGGVRTPCVEAPTQVLSGIVPDAISRICMLLGSTAPIPDDALLARYGTREAYLATYRSHTDAVIAAGFALLETWTNSSPTPAPISSRNESRAGAT